MFRKALLSMAFIILLGTAAGAVSLKVKVAPVPPNLVASVQFVEPSGNNILDADETGKIVITLQNRGKGDAFDCRAHLKTAAKVKGLVFDKDVPIGTVPAGGVVKKEIPVTAEEEIAAANVDLTVDVREANGFDPNPFKLSFRTKAFEPPKLVVADMGIADSDANGRIDPREIVELTVRIQNVGRGDARDVAADVDFGENVFAAAESMTHFDLGAMPSGTFKDIKFSFYTNNRIAGGEKIPVSVSLGEKRPRFNAKAPLQLVMNATAGKRLQEVVVKGQDAEKRGDISVASGLSVDVDSRIPEGRIAGKDDIAVVIGNRNYSASGSPDVAYAKQDAQIMKEYLIKALGYDAENIIYAEDATLTKFNEIFGTERDFRGKLYKYVKEGVSSVFIYYVGHGAPDLESNEAYFVPVDANPQYIKSNGYRLQTFYDNLAKIPAKRMTIVLDSCFSGNSEKGMLFKNISPALVKVKKEFRGPANATLFTSAGMDQVSTWYPEKRHSLFTYFFLKGLQGAADKDGSGEITMGEMDQYLRDNVPYMARRLTGNEQQPVLTGDKSAVLAVFKKETPAASGR